MPVGFARCVRPCPFAYGGCENRGVKLHPSVTKDNPSLLRNDKGEYYCLNNRLMLITDTICEDCGELLEPSRNECKEGILAYRCPSCNKLVEMAAE